MDDANPALGRWVTKQRGVFKMGRMDRLDQLQFTWNMEGNPRVVKEGRSSSLYFRIWHMRLK
jgi:hypothetical protein